MLVGAGCAAGASGFTSPFVVFVAMGNGARSGWGMPER